MSIIVAGKECVSCGERFYFSMGSTPWYKAFIYKGTRCPQIARWEKYLKTKKCPSCITGFREPHYAAVRLMKRIEYGVSITRRSKIHRVIKRRK